MYKNPHLKSGINYLFLAGAEVPSVATGTTKFGLIYDNFGIFNTSTFLWRVSKNIIPLVQHPSASSEPYQQAMGILFIFGDSVRLPASAPVVPILPLPVVVERCQDCQAPEHWPGKLLKLKWKKTCWVRKDDKSWHFQHHLFLMPFKLNQE